MSEKIQYKSTMVEQKVCELYSDKHHNGLTVIPWVTYGNKKYPLQLEVLYFENKGETNE